MTTRSLRILWISGPPAVGKSTVAWSLYKRLVDSGAATAYVDIDQLGMCYPEPPDDPTRDLMKARNLAAIADVFQHHGANLLVVSGVMEQQWAPVYVREAAPVEITWGRLHVREETLRERLASRGVDGTALAGYFDYADAQEQSTYAHLRIDATGRSADDLVASILAAFGTKPENAGDIARRGDQRTTFEPAPVLLLCGATGVGKSTVAWSAFQRFIGAGVRTAFIDVAQLGFVDVPGSMRVDRHAVEANNAAALGATFQSFGAQGLILNGLMPSFAELYKYAEALGGRPRLTAVQLHADPKVLAERIRRRSAGEGPRLAGDRLLGLAGEQLDQAIDSAIAEDAVLASTPVADVRVDATPEAPAELALRAISCAPSLRQLLAAPSTDTGSAVARPVVIVRARETWSEDFNRHAAALRSALGEIAIRVDHIGSTSVANLDAKDRIDIQVGVAALPAPNDIRAALGSAGFVINDDIGEDHRPVGRQGMQDEWTKLFAKASDSDPPVNVHIRRVGAANWRYALLFRDYLRANPKAASAYADAKHWLAAICESSAQYADTKDSVCDMLMVAAEKWASQLGWSPEPIPVK